MGTETLKAFVVATSLRLIPVKLNNPLMGTETSLPKKIKPLGI